MIGALVATWQAVRARQAEAEAKQRLVEAEATSKFLTEVFQSPEPGRDGRNITVAETLDRAAKNLDADVRMEPGLRAQLQRTLGKTYWALGLPSSAIPLEEKVRDYYLKTKGPEHPDTLKAMQALAGSYLDVGRKVEALELHAQVLAGRRKVLGPEHWDTLMAMNNLANSYDANGREDEALRLREATLKLCQRVLSPEDSLTLMVMGNLANAYEDVGRREEALKLREGVLPLARKVHGPNHPSTLDCMHHLAFSYFDAGRREDALKLLEEALIQSRVVNGPEHPDTLGITTDLAHFLVEMGQPARAIGLQEQALATMRRVLPPADSFLSVALWNLALFYERAGRPSEAAPLWRERAARALTNDDCMTVGTTAVMQAWFGHKDDCLATCQRMLQKASGGWPPNSAERVALSACVLPTLDDQLREDVLALTRKGVGLATTNSESPSYQIALGMAEYRSGNYRNAEEVMAAASLGVEPFEESRKRLLQSIAGFYRAMSLFRLGRTAEAREVFSVTEKEMKPVPADERNPLLNEANQDYVIVWLAYKEARELLTQSPREDP